MTTTIVTPLPSSLLFGLDPASPLPLYVQIAERIEKSIVEGIVPVQSWLENEETIALRLGASRATTRRALEKLVDRGLLERRQGKGTQVISGTVSNPTGMSSLYDELWAQGRAPTTTVLDRGPVAADHAVAEALGVTEGTAVLRIHRLRWADGAPLAVLTNWLPLPDREFSDSDLTGHGLHQLMRRGGVIFRTAHQRIGARRGRSDECDLLLLPRDSSVLTMTRTVSDSHGRLVDFGEHCYRPDSYAFDMTLTGR